MTVAPPQKPETGPKAELERWSRRVELVARFSGANGDGPDDARLVVPTAREICALPNPSTEAEVLGALVIRGGRLVIGAHTGEGKTTLGLQLVDAIVNEKQFLGKWTGAGGRALVLDGEQGLRTVKRRLREAGLASCDSVDYLRIPDGLRLDSDDGELELFEEVLTRRDYSVVLADPLYKLHGGDSNDERHAVDLMRRLDGLRDRYGFALVLPTHLRKRQPHSGKLTKDDLFGSGAFLRGAEVVLGLQRTRPGAAKLHFFKDRDGDLPVGEAWGLLFDREQGFRRDPEDGKATLTAPERVREVLEADPGMTTEALMGATGYAERTVRDALRELGATAIGKPKRWALPAEQEGLL